MMEAVHLRPQLHPASGSGEDKRPHYVMAGAGFMWATLPALMASARLQKSDSSLLRMMPVLGE